MRQVKITLPTLRAEKLRGLILNVPQLLSCGTTVEAAAHAAAAGT